MLNELFRAFILTFLAEMGDKTQIIAMTFATKYTIRKVLLGVALGVFFNHGLAILLGRFILKVIPLNYIQLFSGFIFIIFGYMSLEDEEDEEDEFYSKYGPIMTVALAFFLGELGDKTQLMALTLSTQGLYPFITLIGTTLGMIFTSSIGIFIGNKIGGKVPDYLISIFSSLIFLIFGSFKLLTLLDGDKALLIIILSFIIELILIKKYIYRIKLKGTSFKRAADLLYNQTRDIQRKLDSLCLGVENCISCQGQNCMVGYLKSILLDARNTGNYNLDSIDKVEDFIVKDYSKEKSLYTLGIILNEINRNNWELDDMSVIIEILDLLEIYLFDERVQIKEKGSKKYFSILRKKNQGLTNALEKIIENL